MRNDFKNLCLILSVLLNIICIPLMYFSYVDASAVKLDRVKRESWWKGVMDEAAASVRSGKRNRLPAVMEMQGLSPSDAYFQDGLYPKAIELITDSLTRDAHLIGDRARAYERNNDDDKAINDLEFMRTLDLTSEEQLAVEVDLGRLYFKQGNRSAAYKCYKAFVLGVHQREDLRQCVQKVINKGIFGSYGTYSNDPVPKWIPSFSPEEFVKFYRAEAQQDSSQDSDTAMALQTIEGILVHDAQ